MSTSEAQQCTPIECPLEVANDVAASESERRGMEPVQIHSKLTMDALYQIRQRLVCSGAGTDADGQLVCPLEKTVSNSVRIQLTPRALEQMLEEATSPQVEQDKGNGQYL